VPARERVDRQPSPVMVPADLLEQLHSRSHPFPGPPLTLDRAPKVDPRSDGSGAKSSVHTGAKSDVRAHVGARRRQSLSSASSSRREHSAAAPRDRSAPRAARRPRGTTRRPRSRSSAPTRSATC
jgi:hypothetical protein